MHAESMAEKVLTTFPLFMHKVFHDFPIDRGGLELNKTHMKALMIIYIEGSPHMTRVCHHMDMEKGSLTPVVDGLIQMKLVERRQNPDDRRKVNLHLTEAGRALVRENLGRAHQHLHGKLEHLSKAEMQRFKRALLDLHYIASRL